jgi:phage gp29-like protein
MKTLRRIANAIRRDGKPASPPRVGQLITPRAEDFWRDYPADGLTPDRLVRILRDADAGSPAAAMELFDQMEEKDAHLYSVATTRRLGLTGLRWQVLSAADVTDGVDRRLADETAAYCREALAAIDDFEEALVHLASAIGRNIAVAELVWDVRDGGHRIVEIIPVESSRLVFDDLGRVRILTAGEPRDGIALAPNKFVVHTPHAASGHPMRGGLLRVSGLAYLGKHFALKDWFIFAEVFGMPVRIARYDPSATADERRELLRMLQSLGSDAAAIFSKAVEVELVETAPGKPTPPYEAVCNFMNREMSKAWLGQTLTVETYAQMGTLSTAEVHDRIRLDLRENDITREGRTVRRAILHPLVEFKFGPGAPVPYFRRKLRRPRNLTELSTIVSTAVNELGMRVPARWAHDELDIPEADAGEATLVASRSVPSTAPSTEQAPRSIRGG